jgi:Putative MetA-pathway of phenol degradation
LQKVAVTLSIILILFLTRSVSTARPLRDLISGLYGGDGITLAPPPPNSPFPSHAPHFTVDSAASINRLNEQITAAIGAFPFSSSVGGFTFSFDPLLNTFVRTTETLGPLFAERAPTLGRGKLNFNAAFTFFKYDSFNGERLNRLHVDALHQPDVIPPNDERTSFELDTLRLNFDIDIRVRIFSLAATYGVTENLDVGILVPIVNVDMRVKSHAQIIPSPANTFPGVHTFVGGPESPDDRASGSATGIGDVVLRAKYSLLKSEVIEVAGALLTELATGSHRDLLGTGTTTIRPFLILSRTLFNLLTPHLNLGYKFNLNRVNQSTVEYVIGFDLGTSRFTFAWELLGSYEPSGDRSGENILTSSLGVKWNPWKQLLVSANTQVPINRTGLRSNLILTFGAEYSF